VLPAEPAAGGGGGVLCGVVCEFVLCSWVCCVVVSTSAVMYQLDIAVLLLLFKEKHCRSQKSEKNNPPRVCCRPGVPMRVAIASGPAPRLDEKICVPILCTKLTQKG
jgi:hypothetical protein